MKKYKQFDITTTPFNPDILSGLLWEFDIDGITDLSVFAKTTSSITEAKLNAFLSDLVEQKLFSNFKINVFLFEDRNWDEEW